jgi:hypothetical protein
MVSLVVDDILRVDWEQVRYKRALSGLATMLIVVAFLGVIDDVILAALMAALFVTASGGDGTMAERLPSMVRFTVIGAVLGGLAYWSADSAVLVAGVLGVATYLGTLAAGFGPIAAQSGFYLSIWPLFALMLGSATTEPWAVAVAFLVGGALAIGITALRLQVSAEDEAGDIESSEEHAESAARELAIEDLSAVVASPVGRFAILRATAVVVGVVVGFWWFEAFPLWVAITVIVVVKPSPSQSFSVAVQRTLGTAIGVVVAVGVAQILPRSDLAVAIAFLISGFLMVAFNNANYTIFATFLTALLVFGQRLAHADAFEAGWERLLATAVGAGIAIVVMTIAARSSPNRREPEAATLR